MRRIKYYIAVSLSIEPEDLGISPFEHKVGLSRFYDVFGDQYEAILRRESVRGKMVLHPRWGKIILPRTILRAESAGLYTIKTKDLAVIAMEKYKGRLDILILFCNLDIARTSDSHQDIAAILSDAKIELILVIGQDILNEVLLYSPALVHNFGVAKLGVKKCLTFAQRRNR